MVLALDVGKVGGAQGAATRVVLETRVSPYLTYPKAALAVLIESDHPELAASLMSCVPRDVGIVFKLSRESDLAAVGSRFPVTRRTAFVSFTSTGESQPDPAARVTAIPGTCAFELLAAQGHARAWLEPLLQDGRAFALATLADRGLTPRYQVEEDNTASIGLARSVGLTPFLTIVHYEHEPRGPAAPRAR